MLPTTWSTPKNALLSMWTSTKCFVNYVDKTAGVTGQHATLLDDITRQLRSLTDRVAVLECLPAKQTPTHDISTPQPFGHSGGADDAQPLQQQTPGTPGLAPPPGINPDQGDAWYLGPDPWIQGRRQNNLNNQFAAVAPNPQQAQCVRAREGKGAGHSGNGGTS